MKKDNTEEFLTEVDTLNADIQVAIRSMEKALEEFNKFVYGKRGKDGHFDFYDSSAQEPKHYEDKHGV